ncbi:hypothetical protein LSCM4_00611 [Leishmania orientalis]|uniref:Uncharacterized protein n=1 Tax=Leishmania orientalis TaxID=2249476 RepID=A0A836KGX1_9TRYP|nr:hypothetical protein LSCM4_00611 [Leishmania orientalis]
MYMDILEQEVEELGAEVMRLRLMVQRVSQMMGAPIPGCHQHRSHVDPLHAAPPPTAAGAVTPADLPVTVESCKQMLPLLQLLLAQQHSVAEAPHDQRRRHSPRYRHHKRRSRRHGAACSTNSSTSCTSPSFTSSRGPTPRPATASLTIPSSHHHRRMQGNHLSPRKAARPTSTSSSSFQTPITMKGDGHKSRVESATTQVVGKTSVDVPRDANAVFTPETPTREEPLPAKVAALTTIPASLVNRLRAQRERDAANEEESSSDSSNVMPMAKSQTRSVATSPSASTPRRKYVMNTSTVISTRKGDVQAMESAAAASQHRAALRPAEEMSYDGPFTDTLASQASRAVPKLPVPSKNVFSDTTGLQHGSVSNSIIHSEQGIYSCSALQSACESPALSHVLEDAIAATRVTHAASTPLRAPQPKASSAEQSCKLLPLQTSAVTHAEECASSASSSSVESSEGSASEVQIALQAIMPTPHRAGVILGGRRPISVQSMTSLSASVFTGTSVRGAGSSRRVAAVPGRGGGAKAAPQMNLLPSLCPIASDPNRSTSSSSDNAAFVVPPPRQATAAYHRDSSFHNRSDAESSRPSSQEAGRRSRQQPPPGPSASQSDDAYSFDFYSKQYYVPHSPRQQEVDASPDSSRVLSNSMSPQPSVQSISLAASAVSHQGSMSGGGYYFGYTFGIGSSSQQSISSSPIAEA